jgi:hypothetical protein
MSRWCGLKVRVDCPECGSAVLVDGPYKKVPCAACGAKVVLTKSWQWIVERAQEERGGESFRSLVLMQAGRDAIGNIYVAFNKDQPPVCPSCDEVLDEVDGDSGVPNGTDGTFHCPSCGSAHPTWPVPGHLKKAGVLQVFLAPREAPQAGGAMPEGSTKPIVFACPNCGANLEIGADSNRVRTCAYCDVDSYLPADLWNRLHPVRRRRAFWLRCK